MKIVILDSVPLDQGDMNWHPFRQMGELIIYERTLPEQIIERCQQARIVLSNKVVLKRDFFQQCPSVDLVQVMATGTNMVDLEAAREFEVVVCNVPSYSTSSVVQHTFSLLLEIARGTVDLAKDVDQGKWSSCKDFSFFKSPLLDLADLHMGLVGRGEIGRGVAQVAEALGMKVSFAQLPGRPLRAGSVALDELLPSLDILSLHCPLTDLTEGLIDKRRLQLLPSQAIFLNTARGPLVKSADLAEVLASGHLKGAGLDVLCVEPPPSGHPLLKAPRCLITPHVAWGSTQARRRLISIMAENLRFWQTGQPQNVVGT